MRSVKTFFVSRTFNCYRFLQCSIVSASFFVCGQSLANSDVSSPTAVVPVRIGNTTIQMIELPRRRLMISKSCEKGTGFECQAYLAFLLSKKSSKEEGKTPPEIGADLCVQAHGVVQAGAVSSKDEISLCYFSADRSYIDIGSLYAHTQFHPVKR